MCQQLHFEIILKRNTRILYIQSASYVDVHYQIENVRVCAV